jgi:hypothetical protein
LYPSPRHLLILIIVSPHPHHSSLSSQHNSGGHQNHVLPHHHRRLFGGSITAPTATTLFGAAPVLERSPRLVTSSATTTFTFCPPSYSPRAMWADWKNGRAGSLPHAEAASSSRTTHEGGTHGTTIVTGRPPSLVKQQRATRTSTIRNELWYPLSTPMTHYSSFGLGLFGVDALLHYLSESYWQQVVGGWLTTAAPLAGLLLRTGAGGERSNRVRLHVKLSRTF